MRVTLVNCPGWVRRLPPLGAALLKAFANSQGHEATCLDLSNNLYHATSEKYKPFWNTEHMHYFWMDEGRVRAFIDENEGAVDREVGKILDLQPHVVGFSLYINNLSMTLEVLKRVKKRAPSVFIVVGGPEVCSKAKFLLEHREIDAAVPGEGENALAGLLQTLQESGPRNNLPGAYVRADNPQGYVFTPVPVVEHLDELPFPDFDDFALDTYALPGHMPTYFGRGCFKKCVFCDEAFLWKKWRTRSGRRTFEELRHLKRRHPSVALFEFYDSLLNSDLRALEEFCDAILQDDSWNRPENRFQWLGNAIVRYDMGRPLLEKMAKAGCYLLQLGIESGSQRVVTSMKKGFRVPDADRVLADLHAVGIKAMVNIMVGFPTETEEDFQQTLDFLRRNAPAIDRVAPNGPTGIVENTFLHKNAENIYGVDPGSLHPEFWSTRDGQNTYPVRLDRFQRLCDFAQKLNLKLGAPHRQWEFWREEKLKRYADFKQQRSQPQKTSD
ncbi:MAG TPA: cobalamin-dependent protein [Elusimicrobiota bacterium]|nr:cobalamin-dependent protein [Elusimicrobiota bacterium]